MNSKGIQAGAGLLAIIVVFALIFLVEVYPSLENVVVSSGSEMNVALGTTPDTSQMDDVKALIWGAGGVIAMLGLLVEVVGHRH